MRSLVEDFTRMGPPPAMLDPITTNLGCYYHTPVFYPLPPWRLTGVQGVCQPITRL